MLLKVLLQVIFYQIGPGEQYLKLVQYNIDIVKKVDYVRKKLLMGPLKSILVIIQIYVILTIMMELIILVE